jgi:superfamily II DNA/RNA helicase
VLEADRLARRGARAHGRAALQVDGRTHVPVIGRRSRALKRGYAQTMPDPKTEELRIEQIQRERVEREQADDASEPAEEKTHERRAQRAAYLKEKLDERAKSEDER